MTISQLSVIPSDAASAPATGSPVQHSAPQLQLSGHMQVHIHLGHGASAPGASSVNLLSTPPRQHPILLGLVALTLAGGGYFAGSRSPAPPSGIEEVGALAPDPTAGLLPPTPALPGAPGELPLALRQQLARPPIVSPPPGPSAPAPGAGALPIAPARNAFGLGN